MTSAFGPNHGHGHAVRILYVVSFLDLVAVSLFQPILNHEIKRLGGSAYTIGLVGSAYGAIQLFSCPIMGHAGDLYGTKLVLIIGIMFTVLGYACQSFATTVSGILFARLIAGWFKQTATLGKTLLVRLSPTDRVTLLSRFNAFGSLGLIVGPYLYVQISERFTGFETGFQNMSMLAAIVFLVNASLVAAFVPDKSSTRDSKDKKRKPKFNDDIAHKLTVTDIILLVVRFLFCIGNILPRSNLQLILESKYSTSLPTFSYLYSLQALVSTLSGFTVGPIISRIYGDNVKAVVRHSAGLQFVAAICFCLSPTFIPAAASILLLSATSPFLRVGVVSLALTSSTTSSRDPGKILGLGQTSSSLARMIAPLMAGVSQELVSDDGPTIFASMASLAGLLTLSYV